MQGRRDKELRALGPLLRYSDLTSAGVNISDLTIPNAAYARSMAREFREKLVRELSSKFRVPAWRASDSGPLVDVEAAIEGLPECYRRQQPAKTPPVRIGINISSGGSDTQDLIRGACTMAVIDLCKSRGRRVELEICYGAGLWCRGYQNWVVNHLRIALSNPAEEVLLRCCTSPNAIQVFGPKCHKSMFGGYRFHEFPKSVRDEYDFAFDRNDEYLVCGCGCPPGTTNCGHCVSWLYEDFLKKLKAAKLAE